MLKSHLQTMTLLGALALTGYAANADIIAGWNFATPTGEGEVVTSLAASTTSEGITAILTPRNIEGRDPANVTVSDSLLHVKSYHAVGTGAGKLNGHTPNTEQLVNNYFSITLSSDSGAFSVTSLSFETALQPLQNELNYQRLGWVLFYSTDNFQTFTKVAVEWRHDNADTYATLTELEYTFTTLNDISQVEFRWYTATNNDHQNDGTNDVQFANIVFSGTGIAAVPEPAAVLMLGVGAIAALLRRPARKRIL